MSHIQQSLPWDMYFMIALNSSKFGDMNSGLKGILQSQGLLAFMTSVGSNQTENFFFKSINKLFKFNTNLLTSIEIQTKLG